jgi:hypothetical protein
MFSARCGSFSGPIVRLPGKSIGLPPLRRFRPTGIVARHRGAGRRRPAISSSEHKKNIARSIRQEIVDTNKIEKAFSKLKTTLRKLAERTVDGLRGGRLRWSGTSTFTSRTHLEQIKNTWPLVKALSLFCRREERRRCNSWSKAWQGPNPAVWAWNSKSFRRSR